MANGIVIDEVIFPYEVGQPTIYFRPKEDAPDQADQLAKIYLNVATSGAEEADQIEELLTRDTVTVTDPFTNRRYRAIITMFYSHDTAGENWDHRYLLDVFETPQ